MAWLRLLQETPDTTGYMVAGYLVLIGLPLLYVLSWRLRRRNLEKDVEVMESLKDEERQR